MRPKCKKLREDLTKSFFKDKSLSFSNCSCYCTSTMIHNNIRIF